MPVGSSVGCTTERCYGRRVVGWKDHLSACAKGVKVGVIDTGFDRAHPAFTKRGSMPEPTIVMSPQNKADRAPDWHGTGVLSLLAGAATSSTPGLIPDADFLVADAFFANSRGRPVTDTLHLLEALQRLYEHGAQIINLSLVGPYDDVLHSRIAYLSKRRGIVFVAAAGNGGPNAPPGYPAAYPEVIAVHGGRLQRQGLPRRQSRQLHQRGRTRRAHLDGAAQRARGHAERNLLCRAVRALRLPPSPTTTAPVKAQIAARRSALDPKETTLAGFYIDKVEDGDSKSQRETYGRGLIKAPPDCMPKDQPQSWAAKVIPRVAAPAEGWLADVKPASFR